MQGARNGRRLIYLAAFALTLGVVSLLARNPLMAFPAGLPLPAEFAQLIQAMARSMTPVFLLLAAAMFLPLVRWPVWWGSIIVAGVGAAWGMNVVIGALIAKTANISAKLTGDRLWLAWAAGAMLLLALLAAVLGFVEHRAARGRGAA